LSKIEKKYEQMNSNPKHLLRARESSLSASISCDKKKSAGKLAFADAYRHSTFYLEVASRVLGRRLFRCDSI
jgi:hypothetical protein